MVQLYRKGNYCEILFDESEGIFEMRWLEEAAQMSEETFKEIFLSYANLTEQYAPFGVLVYNTGEPYIVLPHLQEWVDRNITPRSQEAGVKSIAVVVKGDSIVAQIAVEQLIDEPNARQYVHRFFDSVESAKTWLIKQKTRMGMMQ
ncbi:MAG: hypothetical protein RMJ44_07240 [Cytophagales bacterium]|nr:hypothetical protein [Bernardetiaceae bacterium]MDW8210868.1 hypothetical protein [Cytophagales bacterium]